MAWPLDEDVTSGEGGHLGHHTDMHTFLNTFDHSVSLQENFTWVQDSAGAWIPKKLPSAGLDTTDLGGSQGDLLAVDGSGGLELTASGNYATQSELDTHEADTSNPHSVTAAQAGADPSGTAASEVSTHESADDPHSAYRKGTIVRKATTESITSDTLQDDDELTFAIGANEVWLVEFDVHYDGSSGGDIKIGINAPAGATIDANMSGLQSSASSDTDTINFASATGTAPLAPSAFIAGAAGDGTEVALRVRALISNDATAGNVTLQWAQNVLEATPTSTNVLAGSFLTANKQ